MRAYTRFAVYHAPRPGALAQFAARWLGWDAQAGAPCPHPEIPGLPMPVSEITATPRKYGFHATLKPPMRLAEGSDPDALRADLASLAARCAPVVLPGLGLTRLGGFLALTAQGGDAAIRALAGEVVAALDPHRAPPSEAELARRRASGLTAPQEALLTRWGYPFVMEEFRFHMTLTGRLPGAALDAVAEALVPRLDPLLPRPYRIEDLCLFGEADDGRFHLIERFPLTG